MIYFMKFSDYISNYLGKYLLSTLKMVGITTIIGLVFGLLIGSLLFAFRRSEKKSLKIIYKVLDTIIGIFRSFPFYILIFVLIPFTQLVTLLLLGQKQAFSIAGFIIPLTVAAIPFIAKIIEGALIEIEQGVIEAAQSLGLSSFQIMTKVVLRESLPAIVSGSTVAIITLIGYSAMSGTVGADSLGAFAYNNGVISYDFAAMMYAVVTIIVLVIIVQTLGNLLYKLVK